MEKTNVMRVLDAKKIVYTPYRIPIEEALSRSQMADELCLLHRSTFKTLVTVGASKRNYVFMIPVDMELDLKKCAKAVDEKNVEMIKSKELLGLTGYVHGGCSPIGMKKPFKTVIDRIATEYEKIVFSAGKIGCMVEVKVSDLNKIVPLTVCDIVRE